MESATAKSASVANRAPPGPAGTPRVSVLIDTYNSLPFVTATIDSVLNQTRPPDEIIV